MYSFLRGKIENISQNRISIDVSGVGYEVNVPENELQNLIENQEIKIYTYLQVREDDMKLFGFLERKTLEFFKKLILVSGVGPKLALGIIGNIDSSDMCVAIATENISVLKSIPGVGPKMAQKIIFELKDKILKEDLENIENSQKNNKNKNNEAISEAITALQVLGYNQKQINMVMEELELDGNDVETIIRKVLSKM